MPNSGVGGWPKRFLLSLEDSSTHITALQEGRAGTEEVWQKGLYRWRKLSVLGLWESRVSGNCSRSVPCGWRVADTPPALKGATGAGAWLPEE